MVFPSKLKGVHVPAHLSDLKISSGSHDSEQQGGPSEDPEWSPPDPSRDPVPVAAGQEESGEHLKG